MSSTNYWKSLMASASFALGSAAIGTALAYPAPVIPDLKLSSTEAAWMAGGASITMMFGGLLGGPLIDRYGRKPTALFACLPFTIGWVIIASSKQMNIMQFGRLITGLCSGIMNAAVPVYISEIAESEIRGLLASLHGLFFSAGFMYTYAFGIIFHWDYLAIMCACFPLAMSLGVLMTTESPRWLLGVGRRDEALAALQWLRPTSDDGLINEELIKIEEGLNRYTTNDSRLTEFATPSLYKPLTIVIGLMLLQGLSGYAAVVQYTVSIMDSTGNSSFDSRVLATIIGILGFVTNGISAIFVDRFGRRVVLAVSAVGMIIGMSGIAIFFNIRNRILIDIGWLPVVGIIIYVSAMAFGYGPVPIYLTSELFPLRVRGVAGGIVVATAYIVSFIVAFSFPYLLDTFHNEGVYWIFVAFSIMALIFVLIVPETKGLTLENIQKIFSN